MNIVTPFFLFIHDCIKNPKLNSCTLTSPFLYNTFDKYGSTIDKKWVEQLFIYSNKCNNTISSRKVGKRRYMFS